MVKTMAIEAKHAPPLVDKPQEFKAEAPATTIQRDARGKFLAGHIGIGGRKIGSRAKLAEDLVRDIHTVWVERGIDALREVAASDPGRFCQLAVQVLPKNIDVDIGIDATMKVAQTAAEAFATLSRLPKVELIELKKNAADQAD
jgi:hypothetical protein